MQNSLILVFGTPDMYENYELNLFLFLWYVSLTPLRRKTLCVLHNGLKHRFEVLSWFLD